MSEQLFTGEDHTSKYRIIIFMVIIQTKKFHLYSMLHVEVDKQQAISVRKYLIFLVIWHSRYVFSSDIVIEWLVLM